MGEYLNSGNQMFQESLNSKIYVDKTGMLMETNQVIDTRQKFICISRPRRFGKSMTAEMLVAYYSYGCDSREMFADLEIAKDKSFERHLNQYNVIFLNMVDFWSETKNVTQMLDLLKKRIIMELQQKFSNAINEKETSFIEVFKQVYKEEKKGFIIIIDEWDCIFRENKNDKTVQTEYLDFLRLWLKDKSYVSLAYMTGILPIKKYGTHSALNMFSEYSMTDAGMYEQFVGFTNEEVEKLCDSYQIDREEMKRWYDGYLLGEYHIFNPKSVVESIQKQFCHLTIQQIQEQVFPLRKILIAINYILQIQDYLLH